MTGTTKKNEVSAETASEDAVAVNTPTPNDDMTNTTVGANGSDVEDLVVTIVKSSSDMKIGVVFGEGPEFDGVFIKRFMDTSPFKNKLPVGAGYHVKAINDEDVIGKSCKEVVQAIGSVPEGPLKIEMEEASFTVIPVSAVPVENPTSPSAPQEKPTDPVPPPRAPPGGCWGKVSYTGQTTQATACIGCLCCGLPGLCALLIPMDEKEVYKVDNKLYNTSGKPSKLPSSSFKPHGPNAQSMRR